MTITREKLAKMMNITVEEAQKDIDIAEIIAMECGRQGSSSEYYEDDTYEPPTYWKQW